MRGALSTSAPLPLLSVIILLSLGSTRSISAASLAADTVARDSVAVVDAPAGGFRPLDTLRDDFLALFTEGWDLLQRPGSWERSDVVRAGVLTALGTASFLGDRDINREILSWRGRDGDDLVEVVDTFGENEVGLGVAGALYLPGLLLDIPWMRRAGRHLAQTLLYSAAIGSLMKGAFGRHRPFLGSGPYEFDGPWQSDNGRLSLPSGHTIVAFSIASTLSAEIGHPLATIGLYGSATATALGRAYQNQHWGSDLFVGALIASAIGHGVVTRGSNNERDRPHDATGLSFSLLPDHRSGGLSMSISLRR